MKTSLKVAGILAAVSFMSISCQKDKYLPVPEGGLPGVFSVAPQTQVYFSQGNLQASVNTTGVPVAWVFASNQYEYVGNAAANNCIGSNSGTVDLFAWSTDAANNNWGIHTKDWATAGYTDGQFKDWGGNVIDNGGSTANLWRTLTSDEWTYLLDLNDDGRTDANKFAKARVSGVAGLLIFPDGYKSTTISGVAGVAEVNNRNADYPSESISDWASMEADGCVFLPAAGDRDGNYMSDAGTSGNYYTSTPDNSDAYYIEFSNYQINGYTAQTYYGYSVRLVTSAR